MTNWYWYSAKEDEIMVDLDSRVILEMSLRRLQKPDAEFSFLKNPRDVFVVPSNSDEHFHVIIRLSESPKGELGELQRLLCGLYLMDHVYRSAKNIARWIKGIPHPSLLISPHNWTCSGVALNSTKRFWRNPDAICQCNIQTHKSHTKILECPAHKSLRTPLLR